MRLIKIISIIALNLLLMVLCGCNSNNVTYNITCPDLNINGSGEIFPDIYINNEVMSWSEFNYIDDNKFIYVYNAVIHVSESAPKEFDTSLKIVYKKNQDIYTIINVHKENIELKGFDIVFNNKVYPEEKIYFSITAIPVNAMIDDYYIKFDKDSLIKERNNNYFILNESAKSGESLTMTVYNSSGIVADKTIIVEEPIKIYNINGLIKIQNNLSAKYILKNDIDFSGYNWSTIRDFSGILDGNNHIISNLKISVSMKGVMASQNDVRGGFICTNSGIIKNLTFSEIKVYYNGVKPENIYIAGIVGWNEGEILNCHINGGSIEGNTGSDGFDGNFVAMVGGICGDNMNTISNCSVTNLDIIGVANCRKGVASIYVGGISGKNNSQVLDCSNYNSSIIARGGGYNSGLCLVRNCVGGIVGNNSPNCIVTCIESSPIKLETPRTNSNGKTVDGFGNDAHGYIIGYQE